MPLGPGRHETPARARLEIRLEKHGVLVDADAAFAVVNRIGWVHVDEGAGGNEFRTLHIGKLLRCGRWRKHVGKDEKSECDTEAGAERSAEHKDRYSAPKLVHC